MKLNSKQIFKCLFVVFLVWIVYIMFFRNIVEGYLDCSKIKHSATCFLKPQCDWYDPNPEDVDSKDGVCYTPNPCPKFNGNKNNCSRFGHCIWREQKKICTYRD